MNKKIIWVFGESATGKLTLINNLYYGDKSTLDKFNMNNLKIAVCDITLEDRNRDYGTFVDNNIYDDSNMENSDYYFDRDKAIKRRSCVMYDTENFIKSDNDILFIKGQTDDLIPEKGNILYYFLNKYSNVDNVDIEVYFLYVSDPEELKRRIATKPWFINRTDTEVKLKLLESTPYKQEIQKAKLLEVFNKYGIPMYQIESLINDYRNDGIIS